MGGDACSLLLMVRGVGFQSTPPHGGRLFSSAIVLPSFSFNPRPRMGGDGLVSKLAMHSGWFQSTPPHGGRRDLIGAHGCRKCVSIHAPAWGATPAAIKGSTPDQFQSTPPHGGRPVNGIHAGSLHCGFNPRPRMGGDGRGAPSTRLVAMFQSTPPHGGRLR